MKPPDRPRVAGIGEILWDRFPEGDRLGGAPANFAFHAGQLGATARIVSRLGGDADGDRLAALLEERGLSREFIQRDATFPTGIVRVEIREGQPTYVIESPSAWDHLELTDGLKNLAPTLDAVCFGTLAQRGLASRQTIREFIALCPATTLRLFDINLRQAFFTPEIIEFGLSHATVLKLNGEELTRIAGILDWPTTSQGTVNRIFELFSIEVIAVTLGAAGCEIHTREKIVRSGAPKIACVDAVGAGDAFSAALVMGLLGGSPLEKIADHANQIGAYVASQSGAMPQIPKALNIAKPAICPGIDMDRNSVGVPPTTDMNTF